MPAEPADRPVLDPDDIAGYAFTRSRKGYETDEVRAFLVNLGSRIRESQRLFNDMERRLAELERRAVDPKDLDAAAVTELLGEEMTRVLESARVAAAEIRTKADEQAAAVTRAADEHASATRTDADSYAREVRSAADQQSTAARTEADTYADELRRAAEAETATQRADADRYVDETRATVDALVAQLRATATAEVDALRGAAESVLAERTAEAETASDSIRADADAYRGRVHGESDRYAESTRAAADSHRADVQSEADAYRDAATADGDRLRAEALADAEAMQGAADADVLARRHAAEAEVEALMADSREQGRAMVQEARTYRERVIADLADRRRAARSQLEQLAATRDALAVTLTDVAGRIQASHRSLQDSVIDPREIGEASQDRRQLGADDLPVTSIAVGEVDTGSGTVGEGDDEPHTATGDEGEDGDESEDGDGEQTGSASPPGEDNDVGSEATDEADADLVAAIEDAPPEEARDVDIEELSPEDEAASQGDDKEEAGVGSADPTSADDIFARLRADQEHATPEAQGAPDAEEEAIAEESAESADPGPGSDIETEPGAGTDETDATAGGRAAGDAESAVASDPDADLLDRRDATTDELERQLARRLKRVLSDEQNEVLDLLRRTGGTPDAERVLPTEEDHLERYTAAAVEDLGAAERAGASFFGVVPQRTADVRDVAAELTSDIVRQIRTRLERAFDDGGDESEVGERIRACYREWKTQRIADSARHYVVVAFSRGLSEAAADGTAFRWLVDDGGSPCPDCDDNALAGATAKGEPFPTGDLCPPAHPGCRCLAVPVEAA